jgi:beta-glucosidase
VKIWRRVRALRVCASGRRTPVARSCSTLRAKGRIALLAALLVSTTLSLGASASVAVHPRSHRDPQQTRIETTDSPRCPWANAVVEDRSSPSVLANEVLAKMTLEEKADFVVLRAEHGYENINAGVPRLCIPPLTLQDGPNGIAFGDTGVTQLPASLGIAASFDPTLANTYGKVLGEEARGKGIDAVQGPNLNLARVPESGRLFEGFGEDPFLTSAMGDAVIEGIQSTGVMADAKHFGAYNEETARSQLNQRVSQRALAELYLAPFASAVAVGHLASLMCSYGSLNGTNDCASPSLYKTLYDVWRFPGFVRSDLGAVEDLSTAFDAGLSLIKPASPSTVLGDVEDGRLSVSALDDGVRRVLKEMFAFGLVRHPLEGQAHARVATPAHAAAALSAAEQSIVLLKNQGLLPLSKRTKSIAVIGADAGVEAMSAGYGGARVAAPFVVTPLAAIRRSLTSTAKVIVASGGPEVTELPEIPSIDYRIGAPLAPSPAPRYVPAGKSELPIIDAPKVTPATETAIRPGAGPYPWSDWNASIVPPRTGTYDISLTDNGDTWFSINGWPVLSFRGLHTRFTWTTAVYLVGGRSYRFELQWFQSGALTPRLGWVDIAPAIAQAVQAARRARVAVVFVSDFNTEGLDRPTLELPGGADALIEAVARANPRTVVILNTGGAVLMPWLSRVSAVLEAWYPGEEDGRATAAVLFGSVDPSGRLPITFPTSNSAVPVSSPSQWPGVDGTVSYSEGLDMGYRWYEVHSVRPLFAFGFGLSYTSFALGRLHVQATRHRDLISLAVTNSGHRAGTDVVEAYLEYPANSGEPPRQLRAFTRLTLHAGETRTASLSLNRTAFLAFLGGRWKVPAGRFILWVGSSSSALARFTLLRAPIE